MMYQIRKLLISIGLWRLRRKQKRGHSLPHFYDAYAFVNYITENTDCQNNDSFKKSLMNIYIYLINKMHDKELLEKLLKDQFDNGELNSLK